MSSRNFESCLAWLQKADHDLMAGRAIQNALDSPMDVLCFHAQQAVEKALKGLLTFHGVAFTKTHYLKILLDLSVPLLPVLGHFQEFFIMMTPCAVMARYPGWDDEDDLDRDLVLAWLQIANQVVTMVRVHCEQSWLESAREEKNEGIARTLPLPGVTKD